MQLERPRFASRDEVFATRPHRAEGIKFGGLWLAGSLGGLAKPTVAIVGPRAPSGAARERAVVLGRTLARSGACVLSGLALGIDGAAHEGALAGGGPTIGVLGGGHRCFFPRRHIGLARSMLAAGGAVVSPYAPDEPARPGQFLQRNGVVAALADAVVIVEAAERSGALNTASWAAALGIDVFAYPGDVAHPKSAGCNALIRDGATLVRGPADVLDALGLAPTPEPARSPCATHAGLDGAVAALLEPVPQSLDVLVERTRSSAGAVMAALVRLELAGAAVRGPAGFTLPGFRVAKSAK